VVRCWLCSRCAIFTLPPELVLALFGPHLVDAGYDASLRDLRDIWAPLVSLAFS
jgi:hypothetical protein